MTGEGRRMRKPFVVLAALCLTLPARAGEESRKMEEPGTHVQMPFLIAPMSIDGKLQGYSYITSKLVASTPSASVEIREKLPFIQDAFVRDVNALPAGKAQDPLTIDTAALTARLVADARRVVGNTRVLTITFTEVRFSPLHPKATTDDPAPPENARVPGVRPKTRGGNRTPG
jgi:hypothetical protein